MSFFKPEKPPARPELAKCINRECGKTILPGRSVCEACGVDQNTGKKVR